MEEKEEKIEKKRVRVSALLEIKKEIFLMVFEVFLHKFDLCSRMCSIVIRVIRYSRKVI